MCTSYHVFPEENIEMREIISQVVASFPGIGIGSGRISPAMTAPVLLPGGPAPMCFGMTLQGGKGLLLNARSETAAQSPLFAPLLRRTRCLIPANDFYEWTKQKQAHTFHDRQAGRLLYMAALFMPTEPLARFVIITRPADDVVSAVHDRMPLLLGSAEYRDAWLRSPGLAEDLLHMSPDIVLQDRIAG